VEDIAIAIQIITKALAAYESLYPKFNKYLPQRYHMIENEQVDMKKAVEFIAQVKN